MFQKLGDRLSIRRLQRDGSRVVPPRIQAQSKTVADHIATDPEADGVMDDWARP